MPKTIISPAEQLRSHSRGFQPDIFLNQLMGLTRFDNWPELLEANLKQAGIKKHKIISSSKEIILAPQNYAYLREAERKLSHRVSVLEKENRNLIEENQRLKAEKKDREDRLAIALTLEKELD